MFLATILSIIDIDPRNFLVATAVVKSLFSLP